jgi:hypothetical protein
MGIELTGRTTTRCGDEYCVSKAIIELIFEKLGITPTNMEKYVKKLARLVKTGDIYFKSFTVDGLEIAIRDIYYDWNTDDCDFLDNCAGAVTVRFKVNGEADKMRQIAKQIVTKMLKDIGADKYVKICE